MSKLLKNTMVITALLYFIMGLGLIIFQHNSLNVICCLAGISCAIYGAIKLASFLTHYRAQQNSTSATSGGQASLVSGGILFVFGLMLLIRASLVVTVFAIIVGIAIVWDSIIKIQAALNMKLSSQKNWRALLIAALIMLVIGIILMFDPSQGTAFMAVIMGIALIADAVLNLFCIWAISKSSEMQNF
ncbi:MAG: DUF308 domain-containing protein [Clostridia bacterium]|nr:DUF308 domain-containing protein [Clostridia bacterium]